MDIQSTGINAYIHFVINRYTEKRVRIKICPLFYLKKELPHIIPSATSGKFGGWNI